MELKIGDIILLGQNFDEPILGIIEDSFIDFIGDKYYHIIWLDENIYGRLLSYDAEKYREHYLEWRKENNL